MNKHEVTPIYLAQAGSVNRYRHYYTQDVGTGVQDGFKSGYALALKDNNLPIPQWLKDITDLSEPDSNEIQHIANMIQELDWVEMEDLDKWMLDNGFDDYSYDFEDN